MYMNSLAGRQQSVDELIFHSLILMKRPGSTSDKNIIVPFMWTSQVYNGALLDRLLQIACLLFWKAKSNLNVVTAASRARLQWNARKESVVDIAARVLCGDQSQFVMTESIHQWVAKSREKTINWTSKMIANLEMLLLPSVVQGAVREVTGHKNTMESSLIIPMAFFTHWLNQQKHHVTELGAELLQIASIVPVTVRSVTTNKDDAEEEKWEEWKYHLRCSCCGKSMNTPVGFVSLMSLGTRIIIHHYFGAEYVNLHESLGEIRMNDFPRGFKILPCAPPEEAGSGGVLSQSTLMRMNFCDAIKIDDAHNSSKHQNLVCNTLGLTSALLPNNVTAETLDEYPLVKALSEMVERLLDTVVDSDVTVDLRDNDVQDMKCVLRGRPIQVPITDIGVDPISSLKPDESWNRSEVEEKSHSSLRLDVAVPRNKEPFKVGNLEVEGGKLTAYTPRNGQGNSVLFMLSYYYADCVIAIEPGMSYGQLKKSVGNNVKLPRELQDFMREYAITIRTLVVITDCPKSTKGKQSRLCELTNNMRSNLAWFIPTDFLLHLLPKEEVERLQAGTLKVLKISEATRKRVREPISRSLKYEIKSLRLYSRRPNNKILEVTLSSGNTIFINASDEEQECLTNIQERWLLEPLSSLLYVSGPIAVKIGIGKKIATQGVQSSMLPLGKRPNFWYDRFNRHNLCVAGAIANWLHADGLQSEASMMKKWAESQDLFMINDGAMKKVLEYIEVQFRIKSVVINFNKPNLTLEDTVIFLRDFPAPTILELKSLSSHQRHSIVVSNKVVYDVQDMHSYELKLSSLINNLNGDNDGVSLVSARYFWQKGDKLTIQSCPSQQLKHDSSTHGSLVRSFGDVAKKKSAKKKRRRKQNKRNRK